MSLHRAHFLAPRATPDGVVSWEEHNPELAARIRDGDAALGWLGDIRLSLHLNKAYETDPENPKPGTPRWEVWRDHEGTDPTFVASHVSFTMGNGDGLIRMLAAHDSRTHDIASEVLAARDRRDASKRAEFGEISNDKADKLAWALGRDLSLPAQDGKVFPLHGRP